MRAVLHAYERRIHAFWYLLPSGGALSSLKLPGDVLVIVFKLFALERLSFSPDVGTPDVLPFQGDGLDHTGGNAIARVLNGPGVGYAAITSTNNKNPRRRGRKLQFLR